MNETPIKISEFRRNTKVFLDAAKSNDIWLRREDDLFRLQYMGTVFEAKVDDLIKGVPVEPKLPFENTPLPKNTIEKKSTGLTPRHKGDVLAEIRASEAERDEELRYCQDEEVGLEITGRWELHLKALWAEYNSLKGAE